MTEIQNIEALISAGELEKALTELDKAISENGGGDDRLLFMRGKLRWRLGQRPGATSDFMAAVEINPSSPARMALEQARDVEAFFNPDLYNP